MSSCSNPGYRLRCPGAGTWSAVALMIAGAACLLVAPVRALRVTAVKQSETALILYVRPGDRFDYHYIHSVERSPVWEYFRIDDNYRMVLYETSFCSSNVIN